MKLIFQFCFSRGLQRKCNPDFHFPGSLGMPSQYPDQKKENSRVNVVDGTVRLGEKVNKGSIRKKQRTNQKKSNEKIYTRYLLACGALQAVLQEDLKEQSAPNIQPDRQASLGTDWQGDRTNAGQSSRTRFPGVHSNETLIPSQEKPALSIIAAPGVGDRPGGTMALPEPGTSQRSGGLLG
jgi:hypothetical protein